MSEFVCEILGEQHERRGFTCGAEALDRYLIQQAGQDQRRHAAQVYVLCRSESPARIAGFFTLSAASVQLDELPQETRRKLPRYPHLPAILIGRLAVDLNRQRCGVGGLLLAEAMKRCVQLSKQLGAAVIVVDAKDERAADFYARFGFKKIARLTGGLFLPIASVAEQLGH